MHTPTHMPTHTNRLFICIYLSIYISIDLYSASLTLSFPPYAHRR